MVADLQVGGNVGLSFSHVLGRSLVSTVWLATEVREEHNITDLQVGWEGVTFTKRFLILAGLMFVLRRMGHRVETASGRY